MKSYSLEQIEDLLIGENWILERDDYEFELKLELLDGMFKTVREKEN